MTTPPKQTQDVSSLLANVQHFLDNDMLEIAQTTLAAYNLKGWKIENGVLVHESDQTEPWLKRFITVNQEMIELKNAIRKLAKIDDEVLISGPTGTGKELLAHALHGSREGRFLAINCAGLPEYLIESELFGHVRGAFTGAHNDKIGLCVASKKGTLFLDELGELPLIAQGKLLRVLSDKTVRPVGSNEDKEIDCRFVFATNRNIRDMVDRKCFRADLYARIHAFEIRTLGLEQRPEDVPVILKALGADDKLLSNSNFDLSFNVRSLQGIVKRWKVLGKL